MFVVEPGDNRDPAVLTIPLKGWGSVSGETLVHRLRSHFQGILEFSAIGKGRPWWEHTVPERFSEYYQCLPQSNEKNLKTL